MVLYYLTLLITLITQARKIKFYFIYSSSIAETGDPNDLLGVIISYSIRATLVLSGMGGELVVDLPFKLVHPKPGKQTKPLNYRKQNCIN